MPGSQIIFFVWKRCFYRNNITPWHPIKSFLNTNSCKSKLLEKFQKKISAIKRTSKTDLFHFDKWWTCLPVFIPLEDKSCQLGKEMKGKKLSALSARQYCAKSRSLWGSLISWKQKIFRPEIADTRSRQSCGCSVKCITTWVVGTCSFWLILRSCNATTNCGQFHTEIGFVSWRQMYLNGDVSFLISGKKRGSVEPVYIICPFFCQLPIAPHSTMGTYRFNWELRQISSISDLSKLFRLAFTSDMFKTSTNP